MSKTTTVAVTGSRAADREQFIRQTLAAGKAVRFHYLRPGGVSFHKDINAFEPNEDGDLRAFRQTGGASSFICWTALELGLEAVEL